jgi:hypothetical protein
MLRCSIYVSDIDDPDLAKGYAKAHRVSRSLLLHYFTPVNHHYIDGCTVSFYLLFVFAFTIFERNFRVKNRLSWLNILFLTGPQTTYILFFSKALSA